MGIKTGEKFDEQNGVERGREVAEFIQLLLDEGSSEGGKKCKKSPSERALHNRGTLKWR